MTLYPRLAAPGLVALALAHVMAAPAHAQRTPVYQSGTLGASGNLPKFFSNGLIGDAKGLLGDVNGKGVNPFAISDALGLGLCSNSAATGVAYSALCLGHDASGNGLLTLDSYGGLAVKKLYFRKDGTLYEFPFTVGGIVGSATTTVNEIAVWDNASGTLLKDGLNAAVSHAGALSVVAGTTNGLRITGPGPAPVFTSPQAAGGNTLFVGNTAETPTSNWLETLANYTVSDSKFAALSNTGGYGVVGGSRVSNNPLTAAPAYSIGVGGFVQANAAYVGQTGIGAFFQAYNSGIGTSTTVEIDSVNRSGPNPSFSPYTWLASLPGTMGLWVASGQGDTLALPSSVAIGIINNLGTFKSGIMFDKGAIEGGTGADGDAVPLDAIALPRMYAIDFWNSGNTTGGGPSSRIYSSAQSTHTRTADLVFGNDGLYVYDHALAKPVAVFKPGATSDCGMIVDNQTAGQLGIGYTGTAASCGAVFVTKNVGTFDFFVGAVAGLSITSTGLKMPTLPAVAAGTGKRFLCIDTATKIVYEGSGASCV